MLPILNIALKIARTTGTLLTREFDRLEIYRNEEQDIVALVRADAEAKLLHSLQGVYPEHGVIFADSQEKANAEVVWQIDVLSGAENYARGIPHFAICIAIQQQGKTEHALIYDPMLDEAFSGSREGNPKVNNSRIRVSPAKVIEKSFIAGNQAIKLTQQNISMRDTGCNALLLAYAAAGRVDGFIGNGLTEFEILAGSLLIKSAGGLYSDLKGGNDQVQKGELLAANPKLFKLLVQAIMKN